MKKLKNFSELSKINEGSPNYDFQRKVEKTKAYANFSSKVRDALKTLRTELESEIGYEEGDNDDDWGLELAIQSAFDPSHGF